MRNRINMVSVGKGEKDFSIAFMFVSSCSPCVGQPSQLTCLFRRLNFILVRFSTIGHRPFVTEAMFMRCSNNGSNISFFTSVRLVTTEFSVFPSQEVYH